MDGAIPIRDDGVAQKWQGMDVPPSSDTQRRSRIDDSLAKDHRQSDCVVGLKNARRSNSFERVVDSIWMLISLFREK